MNRKERQKYLFLLVFFLFLQQPIQQQTYVLVLIWVPAVNFKVMNVGGFWLVGHLQVVGGGGGGVSSFCQPLGKFGGHPAENHVL